MTFQSVADAARPLVVDLDGTLVRTDVFMESGIGLIRSGPDAVLGLLRSFARGRAAAKAHVAARTTLRAADLPYNDEVLAFLQGE